MHITFSCDNQIWQYFSCCRYLGIRGSMEQLFEHSPGAFFQKAKAPPIKTEIYQIHDINAFAAIDSHKVR
jgi:hypothetical protein